MNQERQSMGSRTRSAQNREAFPHPFPQKIAQIRLKSAKNRDPRTAFGV
jgi:hypothetical protein